MRALLLLAALPLALRAQTTPVAHLPFDTVALRDLSPFRAAPGWRVVGSVVADRTRSHGASTTPGTGVLVSPAAGDRGGDLATSWEHGDLEVELEFMTTRGAESGVLLQGRYEVRLVDDARAGAHVVGQAPRVPAGRAPGLWQTLAVRFQAPRFDASGGGRKLRDARFVRVELNGVVVHEDVRVSGPTQGAALQDERATGPLVLQGGQGPVAFRNVRVKRYGATTVRVSGLRYRAWQGQFADLAQAIAAAPARESAADGISNLLAGAPDRYALAFDGTLHVPTAGRYLLDLGFDWADDDPQFKGTVVGGGRITIGGREVLLHPGRYPNTAATVELQQGAHPFSLTFYKNRPWSSRNAMTLFVEGPGVERQALHVARVPDVPGAITVDPGREAVVLRSFVREGSGGGDGKRTHAASVGDPSGVHYAIDLAQGALLGAWRGPFVETTEMWHDRGNEQIARPLGSVLALPGARSLAAIESNSAAWPDSAATDRVATFRGYALEEQGRPTFLYDLRGVAVEDRIRPSAEDGSLRRELRLRGPASAREAWVLLAAGASIRRLADGSYLVGDAQYYVVPDRGMPEPVLRTIAGRQELVVPVALRTGEARLAYTIVW